MAGGRPPWLPTQEDLEKIEQFAALGMSQENIARCIGINPDTFINKKKDIPEFAEAFNKGKAKGVAAVTSSLMKNIKAGNVTAQIFYLKCKDNWRDNNDHAKENTREEVDKAIDSVSLIKADNDGRNPVSED